MGQQHARHVCTRQQLTHLVDLRGVVLLDVAQDTHVLDGDELRGSVSRVASARSGVQNSR
jgi:hypothetical protein